MTSKTKKSTRRTSSSRQSAGRGRQQMPERDDEGRFMNGDEQYRQNMQGRGQGYNDDYHGRQQNFGRGQSYRRNESWGGQRGGAQNYGWEDQNRYQSRGYEFHNPYENDSDDVGYEDNYRASSRDEDEDYNDRYAPRNATSDYESGWQGASEGYGPSSRMRGNRGVSVRNEGYYGDDERNYSNDRSYGMNERSGGRYDEGEYRGASRSRGDMNERGRGSYGGGREGGGWPGGWESQGRGGRQGYGNY